MDTVHDLGGREGFGPIKDPHEPDEPLFQAEWKARTWAIAMMMMVRLRRENTGWSLDWFRHVLERLPPDLYLRADYFEKWILGVMATSVDEGVATRYEFIEGKSNGSEMNLNGNPANVVAQAPTARFAPGDRVKTKARIGSMHTRLPAYVRGATGTIESQIAEPQPLPDAFAVGTLRKEILYVVRFSMSDLWPEAADSNDSLRIDVWDSYLDPV